MPRTLWQLDSTLEDIHESLLHAEILAHDISGSSGGRAADPEYGIPAEMPVEGWPLMNALTDALGGFRLILKALRENAELVKAIEDERAEMDDHEARADAASY